MRWIDVAFERGERVVHIGDVEVAALGDPRGEQVLVSDEVAAFVLYEIDCLRIVLGESLEVLVCHIGGTQAAHLRLGKELVENETKDVILVLARFDGRAHFIGGLPDLSCKLLLVHLVTLLTAIDLVKRLTSFVNPFHPTVLAAA